MLIDPASSRVDPFSLVTMGVAVLFSQGSDHDAQSTFAAKDDGLDPQQRG